jgi:crotonobetainyl-CoA:carnitine CoA-transferase CaiB-like acyl-CoA transferase
MQPFTDIEVLDLTQSIAGPVCTSMLSSLGAHVVKVEPPNGDAFREQLEGSMFAFANQGEKESIAVDFKTDEGQEIAADLAERADVVVESFRPGVLEKFDLDYESVRETNEDVIYCSISGFGQGGPYRDWPAYDPVVQAVSGLMSTIGYPDRPPVRIGASTIDCGTGANAAFMVASALFQRGQTGEGEHIDIALFDVALSWTGYWITYYESTGKTPTRAGAGLHGFAPNDIYEGSDDEQFYVSAFSDALYERVCSALGREDLADDERFVTQDKRWENRHELDEILDDAFAEYEREEIVERLAEAGVPTGPVRTIDEVADDEHVHDRDMISETRNVELEDDSVTARLPLRTSDGPVADVSEPPELGEHAREVLAGLGYDETEIEAILDSGAVNTPE